MNAWQPRTDEEEKAFQEQEKAFQELRLSKLSNPSPYRPYQPPDQPVNQPPSQPLDQPVEWSWSEAKAKSGFTWVNFILGIIGVPALGYATIGFFNDLPNTGIASVVGFGCAGIMWLKEQWDKSKGDT